MNKFESIKPDKLRKKIKEKVDEAIDIFWKKNPKLEFINCPFCNKNDFKSYFEIKKFNYLKCNHCNSIYISPRPNEEALKMFYDIDPNKLVISDLLSKVRENRKNILLKKRWKQIKENFLLQNIKLPVDTLLEIGPGIGQFLEILNEDKVAKRYVAIEPSKDCYKILDKIEFIEAYNSTLERFNKKLSADLIFLNSVIEHPYSLDKFFSNLKYILKPTGTISLYDMNSEGMDVVFLRGDTQNYNPMYILQVGSKKGIELLLEKHNLRLAETFSGGELDVEIIYDYVSKLNVNEPLSRFNEFFEASEFRNNFQNFLKENFKSGYNFYFIKNKL